MVEIIWGALCGLLCLLPGWGVGLSALVSLVVPESAAYAIISGLIVNSIVEARVGNSSSGNIYAGVMDIESGAEVELGNQLILCKCICWIIGVSAAMIFPFGSTGGGLMFVTYLMLIILLGTLREKWWTGIAWISAVAVLMSICTAVGVNDPITVIGLSLFVIPNIAVKSSSNLPLGHAIPNFITLIGGTAIAMIAPGVSPQAITTMLGKREGRMSEYITTAVVESLIEAIGLAVAYGGGSLGKAIITSYVIAPNSWMLVSSCLLAIVVSYLALSVNNGMGESNSFYSESNVKFLGSIIGVVGLILLTGVWAVVFIPLGLAITGFIGRLLPDPSARGLTFISLLL